MKNILDKLIAVLPHVTIVLASMFLIFWFLDILNPVMNFVNCKISNKLLVVFCICSIGTSILTVYLDRKE